MPPLVINSLQVMLGGALGALLRYLCILALPVPTLIVNILGSFIIGFTYYKLGSSHPEYLPLINIGLLGGLTTFSSFSLEVINFLMAGLILKAIIYIAASVIICVLACFAGYKLAIII